MLQVKKEGIILKKTAFGFESDGVLNPAVIKYKNNIHIFYRAVSKGNYSSIGYCKLSNPLQIVERYDMPIILPQHDYELHGVEDPRISNIDNHFYLTYTAYDGVNALGALATSTDLKIWKKHGIITPKMVFGEFKRLAENKAVLNDKYARFNSDGGVKEIKGIHKLLWNKNVIFFPRRIDGKLYFLHRIKPDIQIVAVNNLDELTNEFWQNYFLCFADHIVLTSVHNFESSYIGGGCPPIETKEGWVFIYHGVQDSVDGYVYSACAALLDIKNPQRVIARLPYPLFMPDKNWELSGYVNNVCFPTGTIVEDDILYIYYGAADEQIAVASVFLSELVTELLLHKA